MARLHLLHNPVVIYLAYMTYVGWITTGLSASRCNIISRRPSTTHSNLLRLSSAVHFCTIYSTIDIFCRLLFSNCRFRICNLAANPPHRWTCFGVFYKLKIICMCIGLCACKRVRVCGVWLWLRKPSYVGNVTYCTRNALSMQIGIKGWKWLFYYRTYTVPCGFLSDWRPNDPCSVNLPQKGLQSTKL